MKQPVIFALFALAITASAPASACTIPVFRYALEKWDLTRYDIHICHRGPLPADLERVVKSWDDNPNKANLDITTIDQDGKVPPKLQKLWQREGKNAELPWMLVRYHDADPDDGSAWSGPCTIANLRNIVDSPKRREVLSHLIGGDACVFLVLSSDRAGDEAVLARLRRDLGALEKKIKLPIVEESDQAKLRLPLPIKATFPVLALERGKAEESAFIKLLLATEPGLDKVKGPIVFPIFGRGRVLCSLSGEEIEDKLSFVAEFLCKGCSCDVKNLNPGVDMLLMANWNEIFDGMFEHKEAAPEPKRPPVAAPVTETPARALEEPPAPVCFECPIARNWPWIAGGLGALVAVGACFYLSRK